MAETDKSLFIYLSPQPDFPASDLTDTNAELLPHLLNDNPGIESQARHLQNYQHALYKTAYNALRFSDYPADDSLQEYQAFTRGFATFEAISSVIRPAFVYDTSYASFKVQLSLIEPGAFVDVELAKRYKAWPEERPRIYDVVTKVGAKQGETFNQIRSRIIGAQIAFELQRPILDVA